MAKIYPQPFGKPTKVVLGHDDFATGARKLAFEDVPPIPDHAERWEDRYGKPPNQYTKYICHQATIEGAERRWKMTSDGRTLLAYFHFRPEHDGKTLAKDYVSPWAAYYLSPIYPGG